MSHKSQKNELHCCSYKCELEKNSLDQVSMFAAAPKTHLPLRLFVSACNIVCFPTLSLRAPSNPGSIWTGRGAKGEGLTISGSSIGGNRLLAAREYTFSLNFNKIHQFFDGSRKTRRQVSKQTQVIGSRFIQIESRFQCFQWGTSTNGVFIHTFISLNSK